MRLDRWFKTHFPDLAFGRLQKLLRTGQIRVDGARAKTNQRLEAGQVVRIPPLGSGGEGGDGGERTGPARASKPDTVSAEDARFVKSLVIYGDDDVLVIDKPAGLAVQGGTKTERHLDGMLAALADKGGDWTWEAMDEWLKSPRGFANGTKMSFAGLGNAEERANIMEYLAVNGGAPAKPAPVAAEEAEAEADEAVVAEANQDAAAEIAEVGA